MNPEPRTPSVRTIKLTLAYDGTNYAGWQRQANGPSVQGTVEEVVARIVGKRTHVVGSGRTDAGVHAIGQVAAFHTTSELSPTKFQRAINAHLPHDIVVTEVEEAAPDFHPRRSAKRKRYRYVIFNSRRHDVFRRAYSWHFCFGKLDVDAMHRAAQHWCGTHDFRSFESRWPQRSSSVRTVFEAVCTRLPPPDERVIHFEVEADGFLYNMVRTMVGTLVDVGRGRCDEQWPAEVLQLGDRKQAGRTVPPQGLFLLHVNYV